jgi:hypothetical protein
VENLSVQLSTTANPAQLPPVFADTVTLPDGLKVFVPHPTEKVTVTVCPTTAGLGATAVMVVVVEARMAVPLRLTVCCVPGTLPLLPWRLSVPVIDPALVGANTMYSSQLAPGAIGDRGRQLGVPP